MLGIDNVLRFGTQLASAGVATNNTIKNTEYLMNGNLQKDVQTNLINARIKDGVNKKDPEQIRKAQKIVDKIEEWDRYPVGQGTGIIVVACIILTIIFLSMAKNNRSWETMGLIMLGVSAVVGLAGFGIWWFKVREPFKDLEQLLNDNQIWVDNNEERADQGYFQWTGTQSIDTGLESISMKKRMLYIKEIKEASQKLKSE